MEEKTKQSLDRHIRAKRSVYFLMQTETDDEGNYIPCIAVEGERGFYRTDWTWGKDWEFANEICDEMNEKLGISKQEAMKIQLGTMRQNHA